MSIKNSERILEAIIDNWIKKTEIKIFKAKTHGITKGSLSVPIIITIKELEEEIIPELKTLIGK